MNNYNEFIYRLSSLNEAQLHAFFESIKPLVTPEEFIALSYAVSYFNIEMRPEKKKQLKDSMAKILYKIFTD